MSDTKIRRIDRWETIENRSEGARIMTSLARKLYDADARRRSVYKLATSLIGMQIATVTGDPSGEDEGNFVDDTVLGGSILKRVLRAQLPRILSARPRPSVISSDGSWDQQHRAKQLERFLVGDWERAHAYAQFAETLRWAAICGTGALLVSDDEERVTIESLYPWDIVVDPIESKTGAPARWYRRVLMDRDAAMDRWPEQEEAIFALARADVSDPVIPDPNEQSLDHDCIELWESWSCGKKGRHMVASGDVVLVDDLWREKKPPIELLQWGMPLRGVWGDGVAMDVGVHQAEKNAIQNAIRTALRAAAPFFWIPGPGGQCDWTAEQLDDQIGKVLSGGTTPPQWITPEAFSQSYIAWLERVDADAYQAAGISQMSASAQKPTGLTAAAALNAWSDLDDLRNLEQAQLFDDLVVSVAEQWVLAAKRLHIGRGKYRVTVYDQGAKYGDTINWNDVDMDADTYAIRIVSASSLPSHPAARQQIVSDWFNAGLIDKVQYMSLLGFPDVQKTMSLDTAPLDYAAKVVEAILYRAEMQSPLPEMGDQKLTKSLAQRSLIRAVADGMDENDPRIEMLRTFISQAIHLRDEAESAQQAMAPAPPMAATPPAEMPIDPAAMQAAVPEGMPA